MKIKVIRLGYWPVRQYIPFGMFLLLCCLLTLSCAKKPTAPDPNDPIRTDTQLKVTNFTLPKGETKEFPAGFEIIASEGMDIAGDLIITPSRPGDFTLHAESGDIRIHGRIMVKKDSTASFVDKKVVHGKNSALSNPAAQPGTRLFFILDRPGATISIGRGAQIQSGDGRDAFETLVVADAGIRIVGQVGAPGGDIIIRARGGKIILADLQPGDPPLFILGNGGHGANIKVDRVNFSTTGSTLEIIGGRGGDSGILMLEAATIEGIPGVDQLDAELLAEGIGGDGGNVVWDCVGVLIESQGTGLVKKDYPLKQITFRGGDGGNAATLGGKGGLAAYWGYQINKRDDPIAAVSVTGGNGGDVFPSPLPIGLVQGGEGGEYVVLGNWGWKGALPDSGGPVNGANGGDVVGQGGNGGDILEGVLFQSAIGGDGANSEVAQARIIAELPVRPEILDPPYGIGPSGFRSYGYGVVGGPGGKGVDRSDGCPGGDGGAAGTVLAVGGKGGNVPNRPGARGGKGGDVWTAGNFFSDGALGGDGNPPGKGGCVKTIVNSPGKGGDGSIPGENGLYLGEPPDVTLCASDGVPSGEGLTCDDDSTGGEPCWRQIGSTYSAYYEISTVSTSTVDGSISTYFESWAENGMLVPPQHGGYAWRRQGTYVKRITRPFGGDVDTTYNYDPDRYVNGGYALSITWGPRCFGNQGVYCSGGEEFQLYLPGNNFEHTCESFSTGSKSRTTYKLQFTGCNTNPELRDYTGGWRCCKMKAIKDDEDCP